LSLLDLIPLLRPSTASATLLSCHYHSQTLFLTSFATMAYWRLGRSGSWLQGRSDISWL